jgi:hypothetical protein
MSLEICGLLCTVDHSPMSSAWRGTESHGPEQQCRIPAKDLIANEIADVAWKCWCTNTLQYCINNARREKGREWNRSPRSADRTTTRGSGKAGPGR